MDHAVVSFRGRLRGWHNEVHEMVYSKTDMRNGISLREGIRFRRMKKFSFVQFRIHKQR